MGKGPGLALVQRHRLYLGLQRGDDVHEDVEPEGRLQLPKDSHNRLHHNEAHAFCNSLNAS